MSKFQNKWRETFILTYFLSQGETPYNLDKDKGKPILGELFGTRRLNTNEDSEEMYGYDLYSSSLANILTEPSLKMPITVGLYAKWGSGKSFLLGKLQEDMKNFTRDWIIEPTFENSLLLFMVVLHFAFILGIGVWILTYALNSDNIQLEWEIEIAIIAAIGTGGLILALTYSFFYGIWKFTQTTESSSLHRLKDLLSRQFSSLKLIMNVLFHHPPGPESIQAGDDEELLWNMEMVTVSRSNQINELTDYHIARAKSITEKNFGGGLLDPKSKGIGEYIGYFYDRNMLEIYRTIRALETKNHSRAQSALTELKFKRKEAESI